MITQNPTCRLGGVKRLSSRCIYEASLYNGSRQSQLSAASRIILQLFLGIVTGKEKYAKQYEVTEKNRRVKRLKHLKKHPNHIKGMEEIRKALGI